jgi:hypothetical protein
MKEGDKWKKIKKANNVVELIKPVENAPKQNNQVVDVKPNNAKPNNLPKE